MAKTSLPVPLIPSRGTVRVSRGETDILSLQTETKTKINKKLKNWNKNEQDSKLEQYK